MKNNTKNSIELDCKNTIGYSESEDKVSFMAGVNVAISKTAEHFEQEIVRLNVLVETYKRCSQEYQKDLTTISSIIAKY